MPPLYVARLQTSGDFEMTDNNEGWIAWKGGECPIPDAHYPQWEARLRDGDILKNGPAKDWNWHHTTRQRIRDIIAYRLHAPEPDWKALAGRMAEVLAGFYDAKDPQIWAETGYAKARVVLEEWRSANGKD
mgnify:CR=1 FL=1